MSIKRSWSSCQSTGFVSAAERAVARAQATSGSALRAVEEMKRQGYENVTVIKATEDSQLSWSGEYTWVDWQVAGGGVIAWFFIRNS